MHLHHIAMPVAAVADITAVAPVHMAAAAAARHGIRRL
jgi:hypothetical protein